MKIVENWIAGRFRPALQGRLIDDIEPARGRVVARLPDSNCEDVDLAVCAAQRAFAQWSGLAVAERVERIEQLANLVARHADELADLESIDTGKPYRLAREVDMQRAEANLRFFASAIGQWTSAGHDMSPNGFNYTRREALGPVALITPWNLPLYLLTWKLAPALLTGNTVVAKPSELTPLTADFLARLSRDAGFPPGVFNLVHGTGPGCGQALVDHPSIRAISFTGGTATGRGIAAAAARRLIKASLELGGKNPALVFADADPERTLAGLVRAGLTNQGQVCLCSSRILIEQSIYTEFSQRLVDAVSRLSVGDPIDPTTDQGALISAQHRTKVLAAIDQARDCGGRIRCGGKALSLPGGLRDGYFVAPTVIDQLPADCPLHEQEIFGPVLTLQPFTDEAEALAMANATNYGLSATVWTENLNRAHRVAAHLRAGVIWINNWLVRDLRTPFGGMGDSGLGREGGHWSLDFFTETKNIYVDLGEAE